MKKIILIGLISLGLTGCVKDFINTSTKYVKDFFSTTAKPDTITKSIMDKYHIQYLNNDGKAVEWLENWINDNFFIHIEIDKKGKYEQIKEAILYAYNNENKRQLAELYVDSHTMGYGYRMERQKACLKTVEATRALYAQGGRRNKTDNEIYRECMKLSQGEISSNYSRSVLKQMVKGISNVSTFNTKNVKYSLIIYEKLNPYTSSHGILTYKYGFIEPENSNKAYFYTNFSLNYKGDIYDKLYDKQRELDKNLIKKTISLLKSNNIIYRYISDEYSLVEGELKKKNIF